MRARRMAWVFVGLVALLGWAARGFAADPTVATRTVTIDGASKQILTNAKGMTLYYFMSDMGSMSMCTGSCGSVWPALLSTAAPTSASPLPGKLGVAKNNNGSQVTYNGHPLYTYSRDQAPGDTNGQGIAGKWFAATVDLKAALVGDPEADSSAVRGGEGGGGMNGGMGSH